MQLLEPWQEWPLPLLKDGRTVKEDRWQPKFITVSVLKNEVPSIDKEWIAFLMKIPMAYIVLLFCLSSLVKNMQANDWRSTYWPYGAHFLCQQIPRGTMNPF